MDKQELIQALDKMSGAELEGLISGLEEAWQIKRPNMGVQGPQLQKQEEPEQAAQTEFDVTLESYPPANKVKVIKKLRELLGLQLKEAKEFAESVPKVIKEGIEQSEVDAIKEAFKESEAVLTVK